MILCNVDYLYNPFERKKIHIWLPYRGPRKSLPLAEPQKVVTTGHNMVVHQLVNNEDHRAKEGRKRRLCHMCNKDEKK